MVRQSSKSELSSRLIFIALHSLSSLKPIFQTPHYPKCVGKVHDLSRNYSRTFDILLLKDREYPDTRFSLVLTNQTVTGSISEKGWSNQMVRKNGEWSSSRKRIPHLLAEFDAGRRFLFISFSFRKQEQNENDFRFPQKDRALIGRVRCRPHVLAWLCG